MIFFTQKQTNNTILNPCNFCTTSNQKNIMKNQKDEFTRSWIIENSLDVIPNYEDGVLTLRALYYQLVALGMTNSIQHYKRVVGAMGKARRDGSVRYETFSDHDRQALGETKSEETDVNDEIANAKTQIELWMKSYKKNPWENQPIYPEVWIEKKALQGLFKPVCERESVALCPCKGYPSLTFLNDAAKRFQEAHSHGKEPVILYFGDYDATGEDIPRSIKDSLLDDFGVFVDVRRIALMEEQVLKWNLPPAPTKITDSRAKNWDGIGQVELDAVNPKELQQLAEDSITDVFDYSLYKELLKVQRIEKIQYTKELKLFVDNI